MINRTKIKDSIYDILEEDPKKIQKYIEKEAKKTPEKKKKEKEKRDKRSNITDVNLQENIDNQDDNPYNKIVIYTEKDNLVHNYFYDFDMYWDAGDCMSSAILKLPKTNVDNTKYWITYTGDVVIYLGNEINTEMQKSQDQKTENTYWDLQGMKPIFKGEIGRIKEYNKELEIHVDSIGKRFKQKIPEEFRQSFIYNQNVRDAFQAICEFLGVKYICPPGKPPEQDNQTEDTSGNGDGTENNVNNATTQEQQLASVASAAIENIKKATTNQNSNKNQNNNSENNANTDTNNLTSDPTMQNNQTQNTLDENTQQTDVQNGFSDISFDANGGIVHGSSSIITSPDMEDTLLSLEEHPLDSYLDDTTFIATDVKKFLNGEMFDTIHNAVMSYDSITVQPKSSASSDMSTVGGTTNMDANNDGTVSKEEAKQYGQNLTSKMSPGLSLGNVTIIPTNTQSNKNSSSSSSSSTQGKRKLTMAYIRTLTTSHAAELAKRTNEFDTNTIKALRRRAMGLYW